MNPRIEEVWMAAGGVWYATVRFGVGGRQHLRIETMTALAEDAVAMRAAREAEPDPGPNLPCCGYPRAECECEACWRCGEQHRNEPEVIDCEKRHERQEVGT